MVTLESHSKKTLATPDRVIKEFESVSHTFTITTLYSDLLWYDFLSPIVIADPLSSAQMSSETQSGFLKIAARTLENPLTRLFTLSIATTQLI